MAKSEYTFTQPYSGISNIYMNSSSFDSEYSNLSSTGKYITAGSLGTTTDPRTANILQETSSKLSTGAKHIEVAQISPQIFDSIPKQQLKEVHRLSKLTGSDISLHGPVQGVEPSGLGEQGYNEFQRQATERRISDTLKRAHELNPDKGIPVVFHTSSGIPGSELLPESERKKLEKEGKFGKYRKLLVVDRETGKLAPLEPETKYYPEMEQIKPEIQRLIDSGKMKKEDLLPEHIEQVSLEKGKYYSPEDRIKSLNRTKWENELNQILFNQERAQEILEKNEFQIRPLGESIGEMIKKGVSDEDIFKTLTPSQKKAYQNLIAADRYLQDVHQQINGLFSKAYEFGDEKQRKELKKLSKEYLDIVGKKDSDPFERRVAESQAMRHINNRLEKVAPNMFVPVEDFAIDKSAQTFGKSAFEAYKEFKDRAPVIAIENPPAGTAVINTGEDLARLVEKSREQFVDYAKKEGMSEAKAKKQAEKLIGATWDVGHINMLRGQGFSEEEIIKETEKIAKHVKHVHFSDNFGFEHTELPMGMGNVPLQKMMERLGEKGFEAKKIIEAANWYEHFKSPAFQPTLEGVGSPVYSAGAETGGIYWNQAPGFYQGYSEGLSGEWLPQIHYETFGGGFSQLPLDLGGQRAGRGGGRMGGGGME